PDRKIGPIALLEHGMYVLQFQVKIPIKRANAAVSAQTWHERLCHVNVQAIQNTLISKAVQGIDQFPNKWKTDKCEYCAIGKIRRDPHPTVENKRNYLVGEHFSSDLCGPMEVPSIGGNKYFLLIKDEKSGFLIVYFIKE